MRTGRGAHLAVPPAGGERRRGWRGYGRNYRSQPRIEFKPRPHTALTIGNFTFEALIDSGSETSLINAEVAEILGREGFEITTGEGRIQLADDQEAATEGAITVEVAGRTATHTFGILPHLFGEVFIGVDLQAKLRLSVPAPPLHVLRTVMHCCTTGGLAGKTPEEDERLREFLRDEHAEFEGVRGPTGQTQHRNRLKDATPIKQRYRPRNPAMQAIIDTEVDEMLARGIIEPSHSPWSSLIVVVKKKDGWQRFCIDFRRVKDVTHKDAYPLPQITATLDKLRGARYLSTLDLKDGYWQGEGPVSARCDSAPTR